MDIVEGYFVCMKTTQLLPQIEKQEFPSFVYTYPSPRSYVNIADFSIDSLIFRDELAYTDNLNLYIHIPFCEQKCTFCPYLTLTNPKESFQDEYIDAVINELEMYQNIIESKNIVTINFGGGTPSLLTEKQFEKIIRKLKQINTHIDKTLLELSIETTPETVSYKKFSGFKNMGLTRVSMGVESLIDEEIFLANRNNKQKDVENAIEILKKIEIQNICCDLMYGIEGQTIKSWKESVQNILAYMPTTLELFALTTRDHTALGKREKKREKNSKEIEHSLLKSLLKKTESSKRTEETAVFLMSNSEKYDCYVLARNMLEEKEYAYSNHVFSLLRGGYLQQNNIFSGQSLLGFGVGARSYAKNMHVRNTYDIHAMKATKEYMQKIKKNIRPIETGFLFNKEEKIRQYVIYHLEKINKKEFQNTFQENFETIFSSFKTDAITLDLAIDTKDSFILTKKGLQYKDLLCHVLFSEEVSKKER